jgi:hypothetical protein
MDNHHAIAGGITSNQSIPLLKMAASPSATALTVIGTLIVPPTRGTRTTARGLSAQIAIKINLVNGAITMFAAILAAPIDMEHVQVTAIRIPITDPMGSILHSVSTSRDVAAIRSEMLGVIIALLVVLIATTVQHQGMSDHFVALTAIVVPHRVAIDHFVVSTAIAVPHRVANGPSAVLIATAVPRVVSTVAADLRAALIAAIASLIMHRSGIHRIHVGRVVRRRNISTPSVSSLPRMHLWSISRVTTSVSIRRNSRSVGDRLRQDVLSRGKRPLINLSHALRTRNCTLRACLMDVS